jgi:hypothetical protein
MQIPVLLQNTGFQKRYNHKDQGIQGKITSAQ